MSVLSEVLRQVTPGLRKLGCKARSDKITLPLRHRMTILGAKKGAYPKVENGPGPAGNWRRGRSRALNAFQRLTTAINGHADYAIEVLQANRSILQVEKKTITNGFQHVPPFGVVR
ncbi:MAG: hypothetical protein AAGH70_08525 [Pseudomonadota bacterium]